MTKLLAYTWSHLKRNLESEDVKNKNTDILTTPEQVQKTIFKISKPIWR
jgi:hypothetical protein